MAIKLPKTVKLNFDGEKIECLVQQRNGEIVCTAKDGRFTKFSATGNFVDAVKAYNEANKFVPDPADDSAEEAAAADSELDAWMKED